MLNKDEVAKIATLARIALSENEIEKFQKELASVLEYFEILQELDVNDVPPMTHSVVLENVQRTDTAEAKEPGKAEQLLNMAPEKKDKYLKVKSIL